MNHRRNPSESLSEGAVKLRGYRSRYQAFLQQKTQKPAAQLQHQIEKISHFGQTATNAAIFVGMFLAILTLFGIGFSQLRPGQAQQSPDPPAVSTTETPLPAPSAEPAEAKRRVSEQKRKHR